MRFEFLIAGPCAAESERQLMDTAAQLRDEVCAHGWKLAYFRAGAWKPRSKPDSFEGMGERALPWLAEVQQQYGFAVCTEVMTPQQVELCLKHDIRALWVGARTCVNPASVQLIADAVKGEPVTIMVKNPMIPDLKLWAGNVERFLNAGVPQVIAIHRGFADSNENIYRTDPRGASPTRPPQPSPLTPPQREHPSQRTPMGDPHRPESAIPRSAHSLRPFAHLRTHPLDSANRTTVARLRI